MPPQPPMKGHRQKRFQASFLGDFLLILSIYLRNFRLLQKEQFHLGGGLNPEPPKHANTPLPCTITITATMTSKACHHNCETNETITASNDYNHHHDHR